MPPVHAPSALDDPIRLAAVVEAGLLDSERENAFDDLTRPGAVVAAALEHCGGEASDDTAAVVLRMPVA